MIFFSSNTVNRGLMNSPNMFIVRDLQMQELIWMLLGFQNLWRTFHDDQFDRLLGDVKIIHERTLPPTPCIKQQNIAAKHFQPSIRQKVP